MARDAVIGGLRRMWVTTRVAARVVDPRHRPLPHIVVIGAQRSGTTSLYELLAGHPQVRPPVRKEIQFLSIRWDRGLPWYRRHFPVLSDASLRTCEASPYYLFHPSAPVRAAAALPDTKFIALLREPSTRAISHYVHNRVNGLEPLDFESALAIEADRLDTDPFGRNHRLYSYVSRGLYAEQIRHWRDAVGDRLLVLLSDDLFHRPRQTFRQMQAFVGLDLWNPTDFPILSRRRHNLGDDLTPRLHRRLQERFAAPNRELAALIGRDLSEWSDGADVTPRADVDSDWIDEMG